MRTLIKSFEITSICKFDLTEEFRDNKEALKIISEMDNKDMKYLASKMADSYCGCCFSSSLRVIFEERFLNE